MLEIQNWQITFTSEGTIILALRGQGDLISGCLSPEAAVALGNALVQLGRVAQPSKAHVSLIYPDVYAAPKPIQAMDGVFAYAAPFPGK